MHETCWIRVALNSARPDRELRGAESNWPREGRYHRNALPRLNRQLSVEGRLLGGSMVDHLEPGLRRERLLGIMRGRQLLRSHEMSLRTRQDREPHAEDPAHREG